MGLFHHRATTSSSHSQPSSHSHSHSMDPQSSNQQQTLDSRSSSSSTRSGYSAHSNTTVKARGSRPSSSIAPQNTLAHAHSGVAPPQHQHQDDVDMTDSIYQSRADSRQSHGKRSSYAPPVPPSRTSSLGHSEASAIMMSATHIPSSLQPQSTSVAKQGLKKNKKDLTIHPNTLLSPGERPHPLGHGSLEVSEVDLPAVDDHFTFPVQSQPQIGEAMNDESDDAEETAKRNEEKRLAREKIERTREQGRIRQARKRDKDRAKKQARNLNAEQPGIMFQSSNNTSTTSLAPLSMPIASSSTTSPLGTSTSTSSFHSSLPTSASFPSLSPGASFFDMSSGHKASGFSSPNTLFSPVTTGHDGQIWSNGIRNYASKSAVDVRTPAHSSVRKPKQATHRGSSASLSMMSMTPDQPPPPIIISNPLHPNPAKRRRSEPEPELFKRGEVGLGVMGIAENDPMEYLESPHKPSAGGSHYLTATSTKERPGIRRTTSESAAVMLNSSTAPGPGSRSPTPPPLQPRQRAYYSTTHPDTSSTSTQRLDQASDDGRLFAQTIASFLPSSKHPAVRAAVSSLDITSQDLSAMSLDLAACYDKFRLEKEMKAVSLEDPSYHSRSMSAYTSYATTPLQESAPLSTASTCSSSPTTTRVNLPLGNALPTATVSMHSLGMVPTSSGSSDRDTQTSSTTPKGKTPGTNRVRSLSSASMRGAGSKLVAGLTRTPVVPLYNQDQPLVSPMSSTSFQFPNTPSINRMQGSDGASPMMSSVQTPNTGQSAYFNHEEIEASTAAGQGVYGGHRSGSEHHQRSATDPMGSKVYHSTSRSSQSFAGFPTSGSGGTNHRAVYHRPSATSSGLPSPVEMAMHYRQHSHNSSMSDLNSIQPSPHLYSAFPTTPSDTVQSQAQQLQGPFSGFTALATQPHLSTPSSQTHRPSTHHGHTSSIGTPFTPTPMAYNHAHAHAHAPRPSYPGASGSMWQPPFTPIAEQGTPTRPSPHPATPNMMLAQPQGNETVRHGDLDQRMLSPNPIPAPLESGWTGFQHQHQHQHQHQQLQHHVGHVASMPDFGADPFVVSNAPPHQSS